MSYEIVFLTRDEKMDSPEKFFLFNDKLTNFPDITNSIKIFKLSNEFLTEVELIKIIEDLNYLDEKTPVIILDEKVSSSSDKEFFSELINFFQGVFTEIDLFYLSNFMDSCKFLENLEIKIPEKLKNYDFYKSKSPNGITGLVSSFEKWKKIKDLLETENYNFSLNEKLSSLVINEKIKAGSSWPRIFFPDITKISNDLENYYTYPCKTNLNFLKDYSEETENFSLYWFVFGIFSIITVYLVLTKVPKLTLLNFMNNITQKEIRTSFF